MDNFSLKSIYLSISVAIASTAGGWALTDRLAGADAAWAFLTLGVSLIVCMIALQLTFYLRARDRLFYRVLFLVGHSFSIIWFMMCLFLPLFWVEAIPSAVKALMGVAILSLCGFNYSEALKEFQRGWAADGERNFSECYDSESAALDWRKIVSPMRLQLKSFLPGIPLGAQPFVSVLLVASMLVGLNLRKVFPIFSAFAWGIPCVVGVSVLVQMAGLCIAQACKILELEKRTGRQIAPKS